MRVGIVGAGICGAAVAERLRSVRGGDVELVVLDAADRIGGRIASVTVGGAEFEAGASLFHSANTLLNGYVENLGLRAVPAGSPSSTVGVWNGSRFVFRTTGSPRRDDLLMLATFRFPLLRMAKLTRKLVARLGRVYPMLAGGAHWPGPLELLRSVDLDGLVVTFVRGALRGGCFGRGAPPDFVLTTAGHQPFLSLERIGDGVFKVFSDVEPPESLLHRLFERVDDRLAVVWDAYPVLTPTTARPSFRPAPGLYDATALEHFVSTMETQSIAGHATANQSRELTTSRTS